MRFKSISNLWFLVYLFLFMNCVIWNVCSIKNGIAIAEVKRLIVDHRLSFICLLKPLLDSSKQSGTAHNLGLILLVAIIIKFGWFGGNLLIIYSFCSDQWLHISIFLHVSSVIFYSFIYAICNYIDKHPLWADLATISSSILGPWLVGEILVWSLTLLSILVLFLLSFRVLILLTWFVTLLSLGVYIRGVVFLLLLL